MSIEDLFFKRNLKDDDKINGEELKVIIALVKAILSANKYSISKGGPEMPGGMQPLLESINLKLSKLVGLDPELGVNHTPEDFE